MISILLATRNPHKAREFLELLGDQFQITDLETLPSIKLPEETGSTFEQNAVLKAVTVAKMVDKLVIADDSGLEVDALDGAPGIFSARYAGVKAGNAANIDKLLLELKNLPQRSARFRCVIALARAGDVLGTFEGVVEGTIVEVRRGSSGFGYDPVFQPSGFNQTFAEIAPTSKNRISHRAKAVAALRARLRKMTN